jgi:hypothetical protein
MMVASLWLSKTLTGNHRKKPQDLGYQQEVVDGSHFG